MNGMREGTVTLNGDLSMAELDQAALKEGINAYLKQWILVIGLVNIVVIASSRICFLLFAEDSGLRSHRDS